MDESKMTAKEMFELAEDFYYGKKGKKANATYALYWYQQAAEKGHTEAAFCAAYMYDAGEGSDQEHEKAAAYALKAAKAHHHEAQALIGYYYLFGDGIAEDTTEAFKWLKKAANGKSATGLYYLGMCYEQGFGCQPDITKALSCFRSSAEIDKDSGGALEVKRIEKKMRLIAEQSLKPQVSAKQPTASAKQPTASAKQSAKKETSSKPKDTDMEANIAAAKNWKLTREQLKEFDRLSPEAKMEYMWQMHFRPNWVHGAIMAYIKMAIITDKPNPSGARAKPAEQRSAVDVNRIPSLTGKEKEWFDLSTRLHPDWTPTQHLHYVEAKKKLNS